MKGWININKIIKLHEEKTIQIKKDQIYSVKDVAKYLHCDAHYVYKLIHQKQLKATKLPTLKIYGEWIIEFVSNSAFKDFSNTEDIKEVA